jgi:hypothetical protein
VIEEIIYTSAAKGLKQGSRGFCTVVSTAGMGANMAERLESMSGYRHAFPLNDPKAVLNPVNYSHVTTRMAGRKLNVISRVADAGQDYSGRTNKLAHHIVVDDVSSLLAGPARVLGDTTSIVSAWDGNVTTRPARTLPSPQIPPRVNLSAWKSVAADNGWGGYVAEQLLASKAPVNVIFPAGTDTLSLVTEVLDLIPIPQRWGITFCTYFTRLLAGTECQLRFYLDGTAEATTLRNDARAIKVDLAESLAPATGGALVEKARSGVLEFKQAQTKKLEPAIQSGTTSKASQSNQIAMSDDELAGLLEQEVVPRAETAATYSLRKPAEPPSTSSGVAPPPVSRLDAAFEQKRSSVGARVIGAVVVMLLCGIGLGVFFLRDHFMSGLPPGERSHEVTHAPVTAGTGNNEEPPSEKGVADPVPASVGSPEKETSPENAMEVATANPPSEPKLVDPFEGKHPFDGLRKKLKKTSDVWTWEVPVATSSKESSGLDLFLSSATSLSIDCGTAGISIMPQDSNSENGEWQVSFGETVMGRFVFRSQDSPQPASLHWSWDDAISRDTDIRGKAATAVRAFRNSRITFRVQETTTAHAAPPDELTVVLLEENWTPFADWGTHQGNLNFSLHAPAPGKATDDGVPIRDSDSIYIEADSVDDIELNAVSAFNNLLPSHDTYVIRSPTSHGDDAQWDVGLVQKDGNPKDHGQNLGKYSLSRSSKTGLVKLWFTWNKKIDQERAAALHWAPVNVQLNGYKTTVFPRGPIRIKRQDLVNLGQNDRTSFPDIDGKDLPFGLDPENPQVSFTVIIRSGTDAIEKELRVTDANRRDDVDLAFFDISNPMTMNHERFQIPETSLGECILRIRPAEADPKTMPVRLNFETDASFNRIAPFFISCSIVDLTDTKYWNEKNPIPELYKKDTQKFLAALPHQQGVIGDDERNGKATRLARFGDLKEKIRRVQVKLEIEQDRLKRLVNYDHEKLKDHFSAAQTKVSPALIEALIKARSDPTIRQSLIQQREAIEVLQMLYSPEQFDRDETAVRVLQDQIAKLTVSVDVYLELALDDERQVRLHVVSDEEDSE